MFLPLTDSLLMGDRITSKANISDCFWGGSGLDLSVTFFKACEGRHLLTG
jgi:hypothetical protein